MGGFVGVSFETEVWGLVDVDGSVPGSPSRSAANRWASFFLAPTRHGPNVETGTFEEFAGKLGMGFEEEGRCRV